MVNHKILAIVSIDFNTIDLGLVYFERLMDVFDLLNLFIHHLGIFHNYLKRIIQIIWVNDTLRI